MLIGFKTVFAHRIILFEKNIKILCKNLYHKNKKFDTQLN
jgi:hypothetical protein